MTAPDRGRLVPPDLDDRTWAQLVAEARALVPRYAPQWTDLGPGDLGMTLVELFAYLVEGLTYRLNRVPDKNYVAFLNLLGITRDPATPASVALTFTAGTGPAVTVPRGTQAQTAATETIPPIVFETDEDVVVVPTTLTHAVRVTGTAYSDVSTALTRAPGRGLEITVAPGATEVLGLGFDRKVTVPLRLRARFARPVPSTTPLTVAWNHSTTGTAPNGWTTLAAVADPTAGLSRDGEIALTPTAGWADQAPAAWAAFTPATPTDQIGASLFWIGLRLTNTSTAPVTVGVAALLHNSAVATNALTIAAPEALGTGTGVTYQSLELVRRPLYRTPGTDTPYAHLTVTVAGVPWTQQDELRHGPGTGYRVDPVVGSIGFGDHDPGTGKGHGTVPPAGAPIVATGYRYVAGGVNGNVGAGTVVVLSTPVTGIVAVTNVGSADGGSDEEAIEVAKRRAPQMLRNRDRAVTAEDYAYLAREATTDVDRVACLEPRLHASTTLAGQANDPWRFAAIDRAPGVVTVVVVPDLGPSAPRPEPSAALVREVQRFLDRRRPVTCRVVVTGPRYVPIRAVVEVTVFQRAIDNGLVASVAAVVTTAREGIERFLHPITGRGGGGWQVGDSVFIADLFTAVAPPEAVGFVSVLAVEPQVPFYHAPPLGPGGAWNDAVHRPFTLQPGVARSAVRLTDYELACSATGAGGVHQVTTVVVAT